MTEDIDDGTITLAWARTLIDALVDGGLETAVIAPGSRSTPLVLAAHDHDGLRTVSHLDERSAGFFALGHSRGTQSPTAIITTSGTATANLHPAVIEAHSSRVPLIILTADRPPELVASGANQTIRQDDLYGKFVRWERTIGEASLEPHRLRSLRATGARAVAEARDSPAGPVHLNCPFRKPLEPPSMDARARAGELAEGTSPVETTATISPTQAGIDTVSTTLDSTERGLIVVGPACLDEEATDVIRRLGATLQYPVMADPASGLRFNAGEDGLILGGYDGYLGLADSTMGQPAVVLRVGPQPTSATLRSYLDTPAPKQILLDEAPSWRDGDFRLDTILRGDLAETIARLTERITERSPSEWVAAFKELETAYWAQIETHLDDEFFEGAIASTVAAATPEDTLLFAGNSMPIRDLDRFARPRSNGPLVHANRGVSGIDGTVSSALGGGAGLDRPVVALLGDLAAYHDMNGLLAVDRFDLDATFVVVNNDGGGIFHMLPIEDHEPPFQRYFKTPHGMDFEAAASQYGLGYTPVYDHDHLDDALDEIDPNGGHLIECHVDAEMSHRHREEITEAVTEGLRTEVTD